VLQGEFRKLPACKGQYVELWLARCILIAQMRAVGLQGLSSHDVGVRIASRMAPDQKRWMWRLTRMDRELRMPLKDALKAVAYSGPLELFSCWTCLCGGIPLKQVLGRVSELQSSCRGFEAAHGWRPHPAVLVQSCVEVL